MSLAAFRCEENRQMADVKPSKMTEKEKLEQSQKSGPSGATTKHEERESKFDEEGGDQPQAASQRESDEALNATQTDGNRKSSAPSQSTASDWDRNKSKPSGAEHDDKNQIPVGGQHNQQNPQLKERK
jgi:hypothetical protein